MLEDEEGVVAGEFHQLGVAEEVAEFQRREAALRGAEQVAGAAQPQVGLGDFKPSRGKLTRLSYWAKT